MATSEEIRLRAELAGAIMGIDARYQATFERLQKQVEADDYEGAIRSATECIGIVEGLFRDYKEHFAANPEATANYNGDLVTHYGTRGGVRLDYAHAGGPDRATLLKLAAADIDKALSFPPACYRDPNARAGLLKAKRMIEEETGAGGASSRSSSALRFAVQGIVLGALLSVAGDLVYLLLPNGSLIAKLVIPALGVLGLVLLGRLAPVLRTRLRLAVAFYVIGLALQFIPLTGSLWSLLYGRYARMWWSRVRLVFYGSEILVQTLVTGGVVWLIEAVTHWLSKLEAN